MRKKEEVFGMREGGEERWRRDRGGRKEVLRRVNGVLRGCSGVGKR